MVCQCKVKVLAFCCENRIDQWLCKNSYSTILDSFNHFWPLSIFKLSHYHVFSRGPRDSTSHCVGPSVGWSVPPLLFRRFWRFASGLCITAPAQWHVTDAVVYTALPTRVGDSTLSVEIVELHVGLIFICIVIKICKVSS